MAKIGYLDDAGKEHIIEVVPGMVSIPGGGLFSWDVSRCSRPTWSAKINRMKKLARHLLTAGHSKTEIVAELQLEYSK